MKKINWGIIGIGNIARSFANDFRYVTGGRMKATASRSIEKSKVFCQEFGIEKAYGSYEELLSDPQIDAVYIATPHNIHFQNSVDALKNGKAVLCEKPITTSVDECQKLMEVAKSTNQYLMEAMWTYFLPPILKAKEWIENGNIGELKIIKADFAFKADYNPKSRLFDPTLAGGALLDIGIYPIALSWFITERMPEKITVFSAKAQTGVDLEETMIFQYDDGLIANLTASLAHTMPFDAMIVGTKGYITIPAFFKATECFLFHGDQQIEHFKDDRISAGYHYEIDAVNRDLNEDRTSSKVVPLETSLKLQELMESVKNKF